MALYPSFGTVIHATLRTEDLLKAFSDELQRCCAEYGSEVSQYSDLLSDAASAIPDSEDAVGIIDDLMNALNDFAAPYSYFGTNEGDGADFGWWPSCDALSNAVNDGEVGQIRDLSEAELPGEYALINDHGNITFGYIDEKNVWHDVWSVV